MKLLRVVVAVVVVSLLFLVVEFATCAASCPGSVDNEVPAAVKQEAGPPPVGRVTPRRPHALVHTFCLHSAGGVWPAAKSNAMTSARASTSEDISAKAPTIFIWILL